MKVVTAIANILKMEGVEYLFCFPANPLIDAAAAAGIRPIIARTERGAVNMADGYSRIAGNGKIGVVATQFGPGIENAFGQLVAEGLQQRVLSPVRRRRRSSHVGVHEHARGAFIDAVEQVRVGPFEIKSETDGLANTAIL